MKKSNDPSLFNILWSDMTPFGRCVALVPMWAFCVVLRTLIILFALFVGSVMAVINLLHGVTPDVFARKPIHERYNVLPERP